MVVEQYHVYLVSLDPTIGRETKKSRPCVVISPNELNRHVGTVIIAPMTTQSHPYPTRIEVSFKGKKGWIVLDQIRTVDKRRLIKRIGKLEQATVESIKILLKEMLVD